MNQETDKNQIKVMQENEESTQDGQKTEEVESADEKSDIDSSQEDQMAGSDTKEGKVSDRQVETEDLQAELIKLKNKYMRLYAEFENYKKRMMREKADIRKLAAKDTISKLLPVLDDFNRAKTVAEDESTDEVFTEGVELVFEKFKKALKESGLKKMESDGAEFDAELHEAFAELPVDEEDKKGKVIDTIETGYYLKDKIIRHAKVVVGK